jgi:phosphocarrier protein HPr
MITKEFIMIAPNGMHARPATNLLKLSRKFRSQMILKKDEKTIEMKSMLNIMALSAKYGDKISVVISGDDEKEAATALENFFTYDIINL